MLEKVEHLFSIREASSEHRSKEFFSHMLYGIKVIVCHMMCSGITASVSPRTQRMNSGLESLPLFTGLQNAFLTGLGQLGGLLQNSLKVIFLQCSAPIFWIT